MPRIKQPYSNSFEHNFTELDRIPPASRSEYFSNVEIKIMPNGRKTVRRVYMKNGKGYKSVTKYRKGKRVSSVRKPIHLDHCERIRNGVFVPQLFADCVK